MHRRSLVLAFVAAALPRTASADSPLVISSEGSLPLLLTVPHDGEESIGSVPVRTAGATIRDLGTRPLAEKVASLLEQKLKARPRLVIAKFSRKYLDANRAEQDAMQSAVALPTYQAYHAEIARHVSELRAAFPQGALLLDIHGQSEDEFHTQFLCALCQMSQHALAITLFIIRLPLIGIFLAPSEHRID
jgi:N-formylglutamate amidohydrolase